MVTTGLFSCCHRSLSRHLHENYITLGPHVLGVIFILAVAPYTGPVAVMRPDSFVDFAAIYIACLFTYLPSLLPSVLTLFLPYTFFLTYLLFLFVYFLTYLSTSS